MDFNKLISLQILSSCMSELTFHCCNVERVQAAVRKRASPLLTSAAQPLRARPGPQSHGSRRIINYAIHTPFPRPPHQGIVGQAMRRLPHLSARDPRVMQPMSRRLEEFLFCFE